MYRHVKLRALGQLAIRADKTANPMPKIQQTPNDDARGRPFVLWSYTLPNGDRAAVHLRTRRESVDVTRYRNGRVALRVLPCSSVAGVDSSAALPTHSNGGHARHSALSMTSDARCRSGRILCLPYSNGATPVATGERHDAGRNQRPSRHGCVFDAEAAVTSCLATPVEHGRRSERRVERRVHAPF